MRLALSCALLALAAPARAEVDPSIVAAVKKIKPADYPSANRVVLVEEQRVVYQPDGQFANTTHHAELALTPEGKKAAASFSTYYAKDAEKLELLAAQVVKADGSVVPVAAKNIQDTEQSGHMNIYDPNGRSLKVTFEGLAVGDAVDVTYRLTRFAPTRPRYFADIYTFQLPMPLLAGTYDVDAPAALPLTAEIYHPERGAKIESSQSRDGDRIHYHWSVKDAPQLVPEPGMSWSTEVPSLVVTTDPSWEDFSRWWAEVSAGKMQITDELKQKAAELTKDATSDEQKIKALYDFVAADVRYRGLGVGPRTGYTPRAAAETYTSRWGVCRDVAILLATLLRASGYEAYPVLTNMGDPVLPKIAYEGFNHAIVAMPAKGGKWTFLDPTAKNSSDVLPGYEREQSVLVCTPKGEKLGIIPPAEPSTNLGHATASSVLAADGTLTSTVKIETKGMFDLILRSVAAMMPPQKQREIAEEVIHSVLPRAEIVSFKVSSAMVMWSPMQVTLELRVPGAALRAGSYQLLSTLVTSGALGLVENALPQMLGGLPTRKYALDAHLTFQYDEDETVHLPPGTKVLALPNEAKGANAVSALVATCTQTDPSTIACHRSFQLKSRFIDPGQYTELRSVLAQLSQIARQPVILGGSK
jgi:transglutaminase-like putative cysteine protease